MRGDGITQVISQRIRERPRPADVVGAGTSAEPGEDPPTPTRREVVGVAT
jgi:hypothetical protein